MGKQPQHSTKAKHPRGKSRARVQSVGAATFVVKGNRHSVAYGTAETIAEFLTNEGYLYGSVVAWNGDRYALERSEFGSTLRLIGRAL